MNSTQESNEDFGASDATWIMTSSIVIFTMQTGFGLLESGCVSKKNEVNIMMKNAADVILGGLTYWMFGFATQYGTEDGNPFWGLGDFFVDDSEETMGETFSTFIFQLSFATTATTIVSGAMAERTNYNAYCIFSLTNTVVYCVPAGWVWGDHGFLKKLGAIDYAGSGCVHLLGGASAFVACKMLGPRKNRYSKDYVPPVGNPVNVIQGLFSLWWGWLVFNSGSSFGASNNKWVYASRAAATTFNASMAGGVVGVFYTYYMNKQFGISDIVNAVLAGLVGITAGAGYFTATDAVYVGFFGALLSCRVPALMDYLEVDDPVSAVAVHGVAGVWGLLAVGFFSLSDDALNGDLNGRTGLFYGGGIEFLGVQALTALCIIAWSVLSTFILLKGISLILPIRMDEIEELLGADLSEHAIVHPIYDFETVFSKMQPNKFSSMALVNRQSYDREQVRRYLRELRFGKNACTKSRRWSRALLKIRAFRAFRAFSNHELDSRALEFIKKYNLHHGKA